MRYLRHDNKQHYGIVKLSHFWASLTQKMGKAIVEFGDQHFDVGI